MIRNSCLIPFLFLAIISSSCQEDEPTENPEPMEDEFADNESRLVAGANQFTFDLMAAVEKEFRNYSARTKEFIIA